MRSASSAACWWRRSTYADQPQYIIFPFLLCGLAVIASVIGIIFINVGTLAPSKALLVGVALSAIIAGLLFLPLTVTMFPTEWVSIYVPTLVGLAMTFITVMITNYYTATEFAPVRKIAKASETGHATNIIAGSGRGPARDAAPGVLHRAFHPDLVSFP